MLLLVESLLYVYLRVYDILRHHSRVIILNYYNPFPISLEEEYTHDDSQVGIYNTTNPPLLNPTNVPSPKTHYFSHTPSTRTTQQHHQRAPAHPTPQSGPRRP